MVKQKNVKNKINDVEAEVMGQTAILTEEISKESESKAIEQHAVVTEKVDDKEYNIEVIKDYYGKIDVFHLSKKDPDYEYRFLRSDQKNLSLKTGNLLFQQGGWQICTTNHLKKLGIADRFIAADGTYRVGDNILAFMPKKLFKEKEAEHVKRANAPMKAIERKIRKGDSSHEVTEGIHPSMKGIQTQEALKM